MMSKAAKIEAGLQRNLNLKTDKNQDPNQGSETASIEGLIMLIDSVQHLAKYVKAVVRKIPLQRSVIQEVKANPLVEKSHLSTERLILTRSQVMIR